MPQPYSNILLGYFVFIFVAAILTGAHLYLKTSRTNDSTRQKAPTYIVLNLLTLFVCWAPSAWHLFTILLVGIGGLAAIEISQALAQGKQIRLILVCVNAMLVALADWLKPDDIWKIWLAAFLVLIAAFSILGSRTNLGRGLLALSATVIYLPMCLSAMIWVRSQDALGLFATWLYLTVVANDAFAQIVGLLIGRRQLAPLLSPAKTLEGALGGLFFAALSGAGLGLTLNWSLPFGIALGFGIGLAALVGDLIASAWKRALRITNFSNILGPQGGVLDRFDSLIFAAPIFYSIMITLNV